MERITTWRGRFLMVALGIAIGLTARWIAQALTDAGDDGPRDNGRAVERFT